jgi:hypothetical protein
MNISKNRRRGSSVRAGEAGAGDAETEEIMSHRAACMTTKRPSGSVRMGEGRNAKRIVFKEAAMYVRYALGMVVLLCLTVPAFADDLPLVALLRAQAFNQVFEGFDFYHVAIENDLARADGTREVTAVASGKFLEHTRRVKVLFLLAGEKVIRGQVLEEEGLPPCAASSSDQHSPEL